MWRVHYYLAWFLYIDGQEAMRGMSLRPWGLIK